MNIQWQTCLCDYLRGLETRSSATATSYKGILTRFLTCYAPETVTRRECEDFMHSASLRGKLPAIATMNARIAAISGFYRFATNYVPEGKTAPLWTCTLPTLGITRGRSTCSPRGLSHAELERLFAVISPMLEVGIRDRAALLLTLFSARRRSEIADLLYGDIQPAAFSDGQGGMRQGWTFSFRGKSRKYARDSQELVPIVKNAIDWYLIASGRMETIRPEDPLFTTANPVPGKGGNVRPGEVRPFTGAMLAKRMALYAKQAGLKASLHTLRHTSAKMRYASGEDILSIQALLRHSNLSTTYIYLKSLSGTEDPGYSRLVEKLGHL